MTNSFACALPLHNGSVTDKPRLIFQMKPTMTILFAGSVLAANAGQLADPGNLSLHLMWQSIL